MFVTITQKSQSKKKEEFLLRVHINYSESLSTPSSARFYFTFLIVLQIQIHFFAHFYQFIKNQFFRFNHLLENPTGFSNSRHCLMSVTFVDNLKYIQYMTIP